MDSQEAKDRLISLKLSYKIRVEEEDIEALDKAIETLKNQKSIIEELEKIKDRLEIAMWYNRRDKEYCIDLIDKRISELKGSE